MKLKPGRLTVVKYINYRGESSHRAFIFKYMYFGKNSFHTNEQWLVVGFDIIKKATRTYALSDMSLPEHIDTLDVSILKTINQQKVVLIHNLSMLLLEQNKQYHRLRIDNLKGRLNKLALLQMLEFSDPSLSHPKTTIRITTPSTEFVTKLKRRLSHRLSSVGLE